MSERRIVPIPKLLERAPKRTLLLNWPSCQEEEQEEIPQTSVAVHRERGEEGMKSASSLTDIILRRNQFTEKFGNVSGSDEFRDFEDIISSNSSLSLSQLAQMAKDSLIQVIKEEGQEERRRNGSPSPYLIQISYYSRFIRFLKRRHHFKIYLIQEIKGLISLPTLYLLQFYDILNFRDYCRAKINTHPELVDYIRRSRQIIFNLLLERNEGEELKNHDLLNGILSLIARHCFPMNPIYQLNPTSHFPNLLFDSLLQHILDMKNIDFADIFGIIQSSYSLESSQIKKCFTHVLQLFLTFRPTITSSHAVQNQEEWVVKNQNPKYISHCFSTIIASFDDDEILALLKRIITRHEINWKLTLSFVSVFVVCYDNGDHLLKALVIDPLLHSAFNENSKEDLLAAFLLSRQSCLENVNSSSFAYSNWFSTTFSGEHSVCKNSRNNFTFLMEFLNSLVPFESAWALQTHLSRPPSVPVGLKTSLRSILQDYCTLARTRLKDIEEKGQSLLLKAQIPQEVSCSIKV